MTEYKYRFSIFTATYNRAAYLPALYDCITSQEYNLDDVEWVIVSDGSTDNSADIIRGFISENKIAIKFVEKENGGKHTAWKAATPLFEGRYVITADDDDLLLPSALQTFDHRWKELESSNDYDDIWEVRARCRYENGALVGEELPQPYFITDYIELEYKLKKGTEMHGCRKVEVLRNQASVPEHFLFEDKCSNFPEGVRWVRAARVYKTMIVPDVTRVYTIGHESLCVNINKRSSRKIYNSIVLSLHEANEQRDLLLEYARCEYFKNLMVLALNSARAGMYLSMNKYIDNRVDRLLYTIFLLPMSVFSLMQKIR